MRESEVPSREDMMNSFLQVPWVCGVNATNTIYAPALSASSPFKLSENPGRGAQSWRDDAISSATLPRAPLTGPLPPLHSFPLAKPPRFQTQAGCARCPQSLKARRRQPKRPAQVRERLEPVRFCPTTRWQRRGQGQWRLRDWLRTFWWPACAQTPHFDLKPPL